MSVSGCFGSDKVYERKRLMMAVGTDHHKPLFLRFSVRFSRLIYGISYEQPTCAHFVCGIWAENDRQQWIG